MVERYPPVEPYESGLLEVSDGHTLYWETVGHPAGTAAVYLHGGPGAGSAPGARRYFDPRGFRAVLFDQRGCGRSRPLASGPDSDTMATIKPIAVELERLRPDWPFAWMIDGGGHMAPLTRPGLVNPLVAAFLDKIAARA